MIEMLYIFVDIQIDIKHFLETVRCDNVLRVPVCYYYFLVNLFFLHSSFFVIVSALGECFFFYSLNLFNVIIIENNRLNFEKGTKLALVSTIQFVATLQAVRDELEKDYDILIPRSHPLSPGEILVCGVYRLR